MVLYFNFFLTPFDNDIETENKNTYLSERMKNNLKDVMKYYPSYSHSYK